MVLTMLMRLIGSDFDNYIESRYAWRHAGVQLANINPFENRAAITTLAAHYRQEVLAINLIVLAQFLTIKSIEIRRKFKNRINLPLPTLHLNGYFTVIEYCQFCNSNFCTNNTVK